MNIAIIGSGGREHALGIKLSESESVDNLFFIPGNGGTSQLGVNLNISVSDFQTILEAVISNNIDLVVVGPEQPLVDGIADFLEKNNILVFGATKKASVIEGEKSFAKDFMRGNKIPTADFQVFTKDEIEPCLTYLNKTTYPIVIKADGLAAGKGVIICENYSAAEKTVKDFFENSRFGSAGEKIVIEEFLVGEEVSIFAVTDGDDYLLLAPSQDHKRIFDEDKGPNTGGMGAYAPAIFVDDTLLAEIEKCIVIPTLQGMKRINRKYKGLLYFGLMITEDGPRVIEYNCRFGDPETQAVLPLLDGDFASLLLSVAEGSIDKSAVSIKKNVFSVTVVAASSGYPGKYEKGKLISGLDSDFETGVSVIHAGTKYENGKYYTAGGRVLAVNALSEDLLKAKNKAYRNLGKINFEGIYYRKDIAEKALG